MEWVKASGVQLIVALQQTFVTDYALLLHRLVYYCTPLFVLSVLAPLLFALQGASLGKGGPSLGSAAALQLIWTAIVGLRFNTFRQWAGGEDRPYWWVMESPMYAKQRAPNVRQYPVTCLGSPAAPTHSLVEAGVGLIIAVTLVKVIKEAEFSSARQQKLAVTGVWMTYGAMVALVAMADIFFVAHFPHQVLVSIAIGVTVAVIMLHTDFSMRSSFKRTVVINAILLMLSLAVMYRGEAIGSFNSFQQKAFRWCQRREWMQIDPTPLLDVFVFTGYDVGTAAATATRFYGRLNKPKFTVKMLVSLVILNIGTSQLILLVFDALPKDASLPYVYVWYAAQMVSSSLVPLFCGALVPYFVQSVSGVAPPAKQKKT